MDKSGLPTTTESEVFGLQHEKDPLGKSSFDKGVSPGNVDLDPFDNSTTLVTDNYCPALFTGFAFGDGATHLAADASQVLKDNKQ